MTIEELYARFYFWEKISMWSILAIMILVVFFVVNAAVWALTGFSAVPYMVGDIVVLFASIAMFSFSDERRNSTSKLIASKISQ